MRAEAPAAFDVVHLSFWREDAAAFIEMQKQTTDEACDIFDELFVEGQTYQLSQTDKFSSFNHAH